MEREPSIYAIPGNCLVLCGQMSGKVTLVQNDPNLFSRAGEFTLIEFKSSAWKLPTEVQHVKDCNL